MSKSKSIQFELRKREKKPNGFWTVTYDVHNGKILNIESGQKTQANTLIVSFAKIKNILSGHENQNDYVVDYNKEIGVIDLVNLRTVRTHKQSRQNQDWWLTQGEDDGKKLADLKFILFQDKELIRIESSRAWSTEMHERPSIAENFVVYITDIEDPHQLLFYAKVPTSDLLEKGYYEINLRSVLAEEHLESIKAHKQLIRVNLSPIAKSISFHREETYYFFSGVADGQTSINHLGPGKQITVFVKDSSLWAQCNYHQNSSLDEIFGNLRAGVYINDEPDNFWGWVEFPALMLRQTQPFELAKNWPSDLRPGLLYKSNNIDIGVLET